MQKTRPCPCGSKKPSAWQYDARGFELCRTCDDCHEEKMRGYRQDVLNDPNYLAAESLEDEEYYYPPNSDRERFGSDY